MSEKKEKEIVYTGINKLFRNDNVQILWNSLHDGTIREFLDDWKWIFSYSKKYRWIVVFYTLIGIFGSILPIALIIYAYYRLYEITGGVLAGIVTLVPVYPFLLYLGIALLVIGVFVGFMGSYISVCKYLRLTR